jgi:CRP/FNR family transcriptional regulator, cyclic AMP receptor protein
MPYSPERSASFRRSLDFMRGLALFNGLSEAGLSGLAQVARWRETPKGAYVFCQGDEADGLYLVQTGAVAMVLGSVDGRELVINEMHAGDCFGDLSIITGARRSTGAQARVDSLLLAIPRAAFESLLDSEPCLVRNLLIITARRLQSSSAREGALAFLDAQARLARVLLEMDGQASEKGYVTVSQEELAQRAGLIRQTVAKALGRWRRKGWLLTGRGRIMLLNHARLEELANELIE